MTIKFGTDGWRAVIARDYTYQNLAVATQAVADYLREGTILIGYDRRFGSEHFAVHAAETMLGNGFKVRLYDQAVPTPMVSFDVKDQELPGGIVITASHNPGEYNGFKFKAPFGGSASPAIVREIEAQLYQTAPRRRSLPIQPSSDDSFSYVPPSEAYLAKIASLVDLPALRAAKGRVIIDPMHGSGQRYVESFLKGGQLEPQTINTDRDAYFGGVNPEPIPSNLKHLSEAIRREHAIIGLATDGDADRVGAMDEKGDYINTHQILAIMLLQLARVRGERGGVVITFSQSVLVRRIAESFGLKVYETPIGFKYIADLMLDEDILIGGEESGGIGVRAHIPERDGILNSLLLLEAVLTSGLRPSQLVRSIWSEFGEFHYDRVDLHLPIEKGQILVSGLASNPPMEFAGFNVMQVATLDGTKLLFEDESWILFRQSGTEPVLRIYSEAISEAKVRALLAEGTRLAQA